MWNTHARNGTHSRTDTPVQAQTRAHEQPHNYTTARDPATLPTRPHLPTGR